MKRLAVTVVGVVLACGVAGCADDGICDSDELSSALFRAFEGDTIRVGACQVQGEFHVPSGVTLAGAGMNSTFLMTEGDAPVIRAEPGTTPTTIRSLAVRSQGRAGVLVVGAGAAVLENVDVQANHGIGIGIEDATDVTLSNISLMGPVTPGNVDTVPPEVTHADIATHGLVLVHVDEAVLSEVLAEGFATMGVLAVDVATEWQAGSSSRNRGTGLMIHGGRAVLRDVELCETLAGLSLIPPYSAVYANQARVETEGVHVCDTQGGPGVFQDNAISVNAALTVEGNTNGGIWAQNGSEVELSGTDTTIADNGFAGVILIDPAAASIRGAEISRTQLVLGVHSETETVEVGDGLQVLRPTGPIEVADTTFGENERVGILFEVEGDDPADVTLTGVAVNGEGDGLGAIVQGQASAIPEEWDRGVERNDVAAENDRGVSGPLPIAETAGADEFPAVQIIAEGGLAELLGGTL